MRLRENIGSWLPTDLARAGWRLGSEGRTIWIVDAFRDNGKRLVVRSDEMLSAFLELERITHELAPLSASWCRR